MSVGNDLDAERAWKLMKEIRICMLVTHDGELLRARPMEAWPRENENAIYFLTEAESPKHQQIQADSDVCLAFEDHRSGKFLSVSGRARVLDDRPLIHALWKSEDKMFWSGPDDPAVRALEITPSEAQLWERPGGLVGAIGFTAARAVGAKPDLGDTRKVDLH
ncbi:MAG: pyridoxamine 5'-phosphate oxidase family protein [Pseudomonadota bacterium]